MTKQYDEEYLFDSDEEKEEMSPDDYWKLYREVIVQDPRSKTVTALRTYLLEHHPEQEAFWTPQIENLETLIFKSHQTKSSAPDKCFSQEITKIRSLYKSKSTEAKYEREDVEL